MVRAFTRTTTPLRSAKKQGIWRHEPRESRAAQPTIPALDIRQQTVPTSYLVRQHRRHTHLTVRKQNWLSYSLVDTRRRTAVDSAVARNRSWRMMRTRGVGLFRLLSAPILISLPIELIHGHFNLSTAATSARRFEVAAVCVP